MAFDLGEMLKGVSNLDTGREQIEYIRLDRVDSDPNNFYQLSNVEGLADNIATCGLQQPIRVRCHPEAEGRYMIVSGHRRRAAVEILAKDDPERWREVPCIVERDTVSPSLQQLRLIYANSNTRVMTPAEVSKQAQQVETLLYQLKEEGHEFPGRMRDHVAEVVQVSRSKLARLKVIRGKLADFWMPFFEDDSLHEITANLLAQLSNEDQYLIYKYVLAKYGQAKSVTSSMVEKYRDRLKTMADLICPAEGIPCENMDNKKDATIRCGIYAFHSCDKCCAACYKLTSCRYACPKLAEQISLQKAENREKKRQEKLADAARARPANEHIQKLWTRFGFLRNKAGKSVKEVFAATLMMYGKGDDEKYVNLEQGVTKITPSQTLPYGYNISRTDINKLIAVADLFGCSLDYLLCRTDEEKPAVSAEAVSSSDTGWQTGTPFVAGDYIVLCRFGNKTKVIHQKLHWNGISWEFYRGEPFSCGNSELLCWIQIPEELADE